MGVLPTTVNSANWSLIRYKLESAVGGSGVSVIDVIACDVELKNGAQGFGFSYAIGGRGNGSLVAAKELCDAVVVEQRFCAPEATWRKVVSACNRTGRGPNFVGLAALDVALWDAYAVTLGVPLGNAMGGEARAVSVYGSGGYRPNHSPDQVVGQIETHASQGYTAVKLRLAGKKSDKQQLSAARDACGDDIQIMVDLNEKAPITDARYVIDMAREFGALFVEEPLSSGDVRGYRALAKTYPGLIATGEHLQGAVEAAPFLNEQLCAAIQPDLAMMGGLSESLRVARWAENVGVEVMPHFLPGLFVHLAAAAPNLTWLEDFPLLEPLFAGLPEAKAGTMVLPTLPGHGLSIDDGIRNRHAIDIK